jgi:hypothetical protein
MVQGILHVCAVGNERPQLGGLVVSYRFVSDSDVSTDRFGGDSVYFWQWVCVSAGLVVGCKC